jgi:hypothetical protein
VSITLAAVVLLYTLLGTAAVIVLRAMSRRWREHEEPEVPYGPRTQDAVEAS